MKTALLFFLVCLGLDLSICHARADEGRELLQQIVTLASKNTNAGTTAQVQQVVNENQDLIKTIAQNYRAYLDQVQALANEDDAAPARAKVAGATAQVTATAPGNSPAPAARGSQSPTKLQTSGELAGAHLAGYPALPDVEPVSSILYPTAAQVKHAQDVQETVRQRKLFYLQNPSRFYP